MVGGIERQSRAREVGCFGVKLLLFVGRSVFDCLFMRVFLFVWGVMAYEMFDFFICSMFEGLRSLGLLTFLLDQ